MIDMNYFKRLGLHGGRLVWRLAMIILPFLGYSIWQMAISLFSNKSADHSDEPDFGYLDDYGTPEYSNTTDAQWPAYYKK